MYSAVAGLVLMHNDTDVTVMTLEELRQNISKHYVKFAYTTDNYKYKPQLLYGAIPVNGDTPPRRSKF